MGGGIEAGKAYVKFLLDDKGFKSKLESTGKQLTKWGSIGAAATAPIIAGLTASTLAFANFGSELSDMSQRTGVGAEALSELKYAAEQSGTSLESVERAVRTMQKGITAAAAGNGTFGATLTKLGVDLETLKQQSPEQQFNTLAAAVANVKDPTERASMAAKVFGKSGVALLPMLADGADGLQNMRDKAHALGITLTDEDAAAADMLGDALDAAKAQMYGMAVQIGAAIAGPLTAFLEWSQGVVAWMIDFIKRNPNLVAAIAAITLAVASLSAAMVVMGTVMAIISAHPIIAALTAILALIVGIAAYFGFASKAGGDFKQQLDKIKVPGGGNQIDPVAQAQAAKVQAELQASLAKSGPATGGAVDSATKDAADDMSEVVKWTRATAQSCARMVQLLGDSGLTVGAS